MEVDVQIDFGTQWTSNKITDKGRQILADFKLAPPGKYEGELDVSSVSHAKCPHCGSENTSMNSPFGPTLCRSIHYCFDCLQSFQQFKPV
jgi:ring-1,2-phenylacetyl-CoA epoxidase subunit PaaD